MLSIGIFFHYFFYQKRNGTNNFLFQLSKENFFIEFLSIKFGVFKKTVQPFQQNKVERL